MSEKKAKRIFYLKLQLTLAVFLVIIAFISGFFIFGPDLIKVARALTGNYNKATGQQLTVSDWNNLDDDFVAKSGDTMTGLLNLPGDPTTNLQAVTKQYADSKVAKSGDTMTGLLNLSGDPTSALQAVTKQYADSKISLGGAGNVKIYCGSTVAGATAWVQYKPESLMVLTVDTSAAGFTSTPHYFTNLSGGYTYVTTGGSTVYLPSATGFRFYAFYIGENLDFLTDSMVRITPSQANLWGWTIHWCGVGN